MAEDGTKSEKFPDVHEIVGDFGYWQKSVYILLIFVCVISQWQNLCISFLAPQVEFECNRPSFDNESNWEQNNLNVQFYEQTFKNNLTSFKGVETCRYSDDQNVSFPCTKWNFNVTYRNIVSEWNLVCDREWLISFSKSIYMIGYMTSILIMGMLSDWFGRYPIIVFSYTVMTLAAVLLPASTSYLMFIILRFFLGFGRTGVTTTGFVLLMEIISPERRSDLGFGLHIGWSLGYVLLPGIAWLINDWVYLQLAMSLPTLLFIVIYWIIPESPRWLLTQKKWEKFNKLIENAARKNKHTISENTRYALKNYKEESMIENKTTRKTIIDVMKTPNLRFRVLALFYIWIVNSFVYYGLSFNTNDLAGNPYLNFFLSGLVEFPALLVFICALRKYGRKWVLSLGLLLVGAFCALVIAVPSNMVWLTVTLAMLAKLCITGTYQAVYICTAELFPTVVRNAMIGYCSMFARLGPILAPFVRDLGRTTHQVVPDVLYAGVTVIAGFLVFTLPETRNRRIPDVLEDGQMDINKQDQHTNLKVYASDDENL